MFKLRMLSITGLSPTMTYTVFLTIVTLDLGRSLYEEIKLISDVANALTIKTRCVVLVVSLCLVSLLAHEEGLTLFP